MFTSIGDIEVHHCAIRPVKWTLRGDILALAETPGPDEVIAGMGLVGATGAEIWKSFEHAGHPTAKADVSRGNVVLCRPPHDQMSESWWKEAIEFHRAEVEENLAKLNPKAILAIGGRALQFLFGLTGITRLRGSIFQWRNSFGTLIPVVPVIHPAALMRMGKLLGRPSAAFKPVLIHDVKRLLGVYKSGIPSIGNLDWTTHPAELNFDAALAAGFITYDIETDASGGVCRLNLGWLSERGIEAWTGPWDGATQFYAAQILGHPTLHKAGHWTRFDDPRLAKVDVLVNGGPGGELFEDTIESAAVCWPDLPRGLEFQASIHMRGYMAWKGLTENSFLQDQWKMRLGLDPGFGRFEELYGALDAIAEVGVFVGHGKRMAEFGLQREYREAHMDVRPALVAMEQRGLKVDKLMLHELRAETQVRRTEVLERIDRAVQGHFARSKSETQAELDTMTTNLAMETSNVARCPEHPDYDGTTARKKCPRCVEVRRQVAPLINSYRKLAGPLKARLQKLDEKEPGLTETEWRKLLFEHFKLVPPLTTDGGLPSVGNDAIDVLLRKTPSTHPAYDILLAKKELGSLTHALSVPLRPPISGDGKVHAATLTHVAGTGRGSSGEANDDDDKSTGARFNDQNIKQLYRAIYVPSEIGGWLAEADYSQIELWMVALLARDDRMLKLLRAGADIHSTTAAEVLGVPIGAVTSEQRKLFKTVGHAARYGASPPKVAILTGKTLATSKNWLVGYFDRFPAQRRWQNDTVSRVLTEKKLTLPTGRHRWFYGVSVRRRADGSFSYTTSEREEIIATAPQGCAARIAKDALVRAHNAGLPLIHWGHDSLLLDIPKGQDPREIAVQLKAAMEHPVEWLAGFNGGEPFVPRVDIKVGRNWRDLEKLKL